MSDAYIRTAGRAIVPMILVTAVAAAATLAVSAQSVPPPVEPKLPPKPGALPIELEIGPVAGLTEGWHVAPARTAIPLGTIASFRVGVPDAAVVRWVGAIEVSRGDGASTAICPLVELGPQQVRVTVLNDGVERVGKSVLNVIDVPVSAITISAPIVETGSITIDRSLSGERLNNATMRLFFGPSIAAVRALGDERYLTSVDRQLDMRVAVNPPEFQPLVEWRMNGVPERLGPRHQPVVTTLGTSEITVGRLDAEHAIEIETYEVIVEPPAGGTTLIPQGVLVEFRASTNPPGHENDITWIASTKFGEALPVIGKGPRFACVFNETFGPLPEGGLFQWLGVKADNSTFGQDQKAFNIAECDASCPGGPTVGWCEYEIVPGSISGDCPSCITEMNAKFCVNPCDDDGDCITRTFAIVGTNCTFIGQPSITVNCTACFADNLDCTWKLVP